MSVFDADQFMNTTTEGQLSTKLEPIPAGEYTAIIKEVAKPRKAADSYVMDVTYLIQDDQLKEKLGREPTVRQGIFLDLTDSGTLDMSKGKNVSLGRLREALGQNGNGPWNPMMLTGAGPIKVSVTLTEDKKSPGDFFSNVAKVGKAG